MGCFGVFFIFVRNPSNRLTFVRSQRGNIDQCFHPLVVHCTDYNACISVTGQNYWASRSDLMRFKAVASSLSEVRLE